MSIRPVLATAAAGALLLATAGAATAGTATTGAATKAGVERLPAALVPGAPSGTLAAQEVGQGTVRLSGEDRYATAADVSAQLWAPEDAAVVYLATGEGYADALAMGPSTFGAGPLLLTQRDVLPQATIDELARLRPCFVVVVGGTASVSDAVAAQADTFTDPAACQL